MIPPNLKELGGFAFLEFEKIIIVFYEHIGDKQSWEDIKSSLLMQIKEIVKDNILFITDQMIKSLHALKSS